MKYYPTLVLLCFLIVLGGCTVPTTYSKSVSVKKDASGKVLEVVETETVVQPGGQGYPLKFELLKDVQPVFRSKPENDNMVIY